MDALNDTVLIVEDDPDDRHLIERAFKKAEIDVPRRYAEDGDQAVAALQEFASDPPMPRLAVVLLDLKLPRRSGLEVLNWIRRHETLRRVPVVILTSSRESVDLARAYDLGANSYLVKPTEPKALLQIVRQIDAYWLKLNEVAGPDRL